MATITPFLWFEKDADKAMEFYASVFKDSASLGAVQRLQDVPGPAGQVFTGTMTLCGQEFQVLNGGPNGDQSKFNGALSFVVSVETQDEVDYYWEALTSGGGEPGPCGWLKDKYGLSWQVVPKTLGELMGDADAEKAGRVTQAMLKMGKLDIAALQAAYDGKP
ncbi:MAG TPA: VOC family protein [Candidatus Saccharimonadales bacterium]|nr:VOC family protein [Candidatus Saccharimonadales bacterium]